MKKKSKRVKKERKERHFENQSTVKRDIKPKPKTKATEEKRSPLISKQYAIQIKV